MGKTKSSSSSKKDNNKKKGPKGKKARAKAKLDRQWGEEINTTGTVDQNRRPTRIGNSRLLARKTLTATTRRIKSGRDETILTEREKSKNQQRQQQQEEEHIATNSSILTSSTTKNTATSKKQKKKSNKKYRKQCRRGYDDCDEFFSSSSSDDDDDKRNDDDDDLNFLDVDETACGNDPFSSDIDNNVRNDVLSDLLKSIRQKKTTKKRKKLSKKKKNRNQPDDGMESPSEEEEEEESDNMEEEEEIDDDDEQSSGDENEFNDREDTDDDNDDDENDDEMDNSIDGAKTTSKRNQNSQDGDGNDDDGNDDDDEDTTSTKAKDLFRQRFGQQSLNLSELSDNRSKQAATTVITLDEALELHVTTTTPAASQSDNNNNNNIALDELLPNNDNNSHSSKKATENYQKIAKQTLEGNRIILRRQWEKLYRKGGRSSSFSDQQAPIYSFLTRYTDMFITTESRRQRTEMHRIYMLHILNHVLTSRSRILRHNKQLKDIEEKQKSKDDDDNNDQDRMDDDDDDDDADQFRDQGYTRPTVLVLLPTRSTAHTFVHHLIKMLQTEVQQLHLQRFDGDYGPISDADNEGGEDENGPLGEEQEKRRKAVLQKKGKEWNEMFGDNVNQDDDFKLGISLTPKAAVPSNVSSSKTATKGKANKSNVAVKLYSDFYKSDIIIASPLGLKMLIQKGEGATDDGENDRGGGENDDGNHDFLSSIEICLLEYADVMWMQNWDHVNYVLGLLNKQPESNNNTDFSRVRNYFLDGQAEYWRQLIVSSKVVDPFLLNSFKRFGMSESGSVKMRRQVLPDMAAIGRVLIPMKQVFQKVPASSPREQGDSRVDFFVKNILPPILQDKQKHTMIYIPSYFDFVSLRNIMLKRELSFVSVTEYSRLTEVSRGRARFLQGRKPIMLFTGRCNYFHRHAIKGVRHLILLGLPEHPEFYSTQVNQIDTSVSDSDGDEEEVAPSCLVLFTKYEAHALERIAGTDNCNRMLRSEKNTFMFYS